MNKSKNNGGLFFTLLAVLVAIVLAISGEFTFIIYIAGFFIVAFIFMAITGRK